MPQPLRVAVSFVAAFAITLGLFWFMHMLIAGGPDARDDGPNLGAIRFQPVKIDDNLQVRDRRPPPPPPPPENPPPPPQMNVQQVQQVQMPMPNMNMPNLNTPISGGGPFLGGMGGAVAATEGDVVPLVRISPQYPRQAAMARLEGWVEVEFTITETGSVEDARVLQARPPRVFDREAIRAILRWKFKPRIVDGTPVARRATQTIDFKLEE